jgi:hypothetical protein
VIFASQSGPRRSGAWTRAGIVALALAGGLAPACRPTWRAAPTPDPKDEAMERLRALGYVGFDGSAQSDARASVVFRDKARSAPGFRLFTNRSLCSAVLIDEDGVVRNAWEMPRCGHWSHAELLETGELLVPAVEADGKDSDRIDAPRSLLKYSWTGELLWNRPIASHHDAEALPDGRILTLTGGYRSLPDVSRRVPVVDNNLVMLARDGQILQSLSLWDLFRAASGIVRLLPVKESPNELDLFHCNSVDLLHQGPGLPANALYAGDRVLVSSRHQDTAIVVDLKTKAIVWAWGQGELSGPHDASWLSNGNIVIFDNGLKRRWSRVVEIDPIARKIVWEYHAPEPKTFFTVSRGSAQRLANGNTLIADSDRGHAFEVTSEGRLVWDFWSPFRNDKAERATMVRIRSYERDFIESLERRHGPGRRSIAALQGPASGK